MTDSDAPEFPQSDDPEAGHTKLAKRPRKSILGFPAGSVASRGGKRGAMFKALDVSKVPATSGEIEVAQSDTPLQPLSIREEAFVRAIITLGGDARAAASQSGYPGEMGLVLLNKPAIRARLAHAAGEGWITPEAIVARLGELAWHPAVDPKVAVKAAELLAKSRGLVDLQRSGPTPRTEAELDRMLLNELKRVTGRGELTVNIEAFLSQISNQDPTSVIPDTPPAAHIQEAYITASRPSVVNSTIGESKEGLAVSKGNTVAKCPTVAECHTLPPKPPSKCRKNRHRRVALRPTGWLCDCGKWGKGDPTELEAALRANGYVYDGEAWVAPV